MITKKLRSRLLKLVVFLVILYSFISIDRQLRFNDKSKGRFSSESMNNLSKDDLKKFGDYRRMALKELKLINLDIVEVTVKIEREILSDNPDKNKLEKYYKERDLIREEREKMTEKFSATIKKEHGIDISLDGPPPMKLEK